MILKKRCDSPPINLSMETSTIQNIQFIKTALPKLPSVKQIVWLLLKSEERLTEEEKDFRQKIIENSDEVRK